MLVAQLLHDLPPRVKGDQLGGLLHLQLLLRLLRGRLLLLWLLLWLLAGLVGQGRPGSWLPICNHDNFQI